MHAKPVENPFIEHKLKGRDGQTSYFTVKLPFGRAYRLGLQLAGVLMPVFGPAAAALFGLDGSEDEEEVNFAPALENLADIPQHLLDLGGEEFIMEIFADTVRLGPDGKKQILRTEEGLTDAYSGGNFGELFRAIWWVLRVNYGPFGMDDKSDFLALWSKLRQRLERFNSSLSDESTEPKSSEESTPDDEESID